MKNFRIGYSIAWIGDEGIGLGTEKEKANLPQNVDQKKSRPDFSEQGVVVLSIVNDVLDSLVVSTKVLLALLSYSKIALHNFIS